MFLDDQFLGDVFRGSWNGIDVALKRIKLENQTNAIDRESSILARLNHPHIVQMFGMYEDVMGYKYMVTEFVGRGKPVEMLIIRAGSLASVLTTQDKSIQLPDLLEMCIQTAAGMTYLQKQKIIHRDLGISESI